MLWRLWRNRPRRPFTCLPVALALVVILDGSCLLGGPAVRAVLLRYAVVWSALWLALPAADMVVWRWGPAWLGYRRAGWARGYLWGLGAGALWRLADVLLQTVALGGVVGLGAAEWLAWGSWLWNGLVVVPLLEETFFRGYLQAGLAQHMPPLLALVLQAILFASHPGHLAQGWAHWPSILLFGLIAGALRQCSGSLAGPWGAHGMANLLPELIARLGKVLWS
jgi:membrane protease YdiL (CAAX protease family)